MDQLYGFGVYCIEFVQDWFDGFEGYFECINNLSNPKLILEAIFPLVSIVDSVFASQLLLVMAFGGWLNSVLKWWLLEDRPYWWVRETNFYSHATRPKLLQTTQTCETGPGSPSGHMTVAASLLVLIVMWISHVIFDRKLTVSWWKSLIYPVFGVLLGSVMLSRMFIATHFPHQCVLGGLIGLFLAPALCIYVIDPFVWQYGPHVTMAVKDAVIWHVVSAGATVLISAVTYYSLVLCGVDPHNTVKLAFKWCENPHSIHVSTTPMFALIQCTANLVGWALSVTPAVAKYRHNTRERSLLLSLCATAVTVFLFKELEENIPRASTWKFYTLQFILNAVRPACLLRIVPALSMWPYSDQVKQKVK